MKRLGLLIGFLLLLLLPGKSNGQATIDESIRIISYNIWNGFEKNSRKDTFIRWIRQQDPEVVALQELVGFSEDDLATLGAAYGHPYVAILKEEGYPVGITSKSPITVKTKQVEGFWHGMMHVETYGLNILVIHLSPFEWNFRLKEAQAITAYIEKNRLDKCLIMGDFNSFSPFDAQVVESHTELKNDMLSWDKEQEKYKNMRGDHFDYSVIGTFLSHGFTDACQLFVPAERRMTFPTANLYDWEWGDKRLNSLSQRLDYIMVSPDLVPSVVQARVHNGEETDPISDHYPVSIDIKP